MQPNRNFQLDSGSTRRFSREPKAKQEVEIINEQKSKSPKNKKHKNRKNEPNEKENTIYVVRCITVVGVIAPTPPCPRTLLPLWLQLCPGSAALPDSCGCTLIMKVAPRSAGQCSFSLSQMQKPNFGLNEKGNGNGQR